MSTLMDTTTLVARLKRRIPMNLDSQFCMDKLNESYQWIEQQGAFVWNIWVGDFNVPQNSDEVFPVGLTDMDVGKPMSLYPRDPIVVPTAPTTAEMPYVPMDEIPLHQIYHVNPGVFSVWTLRGVAGGVYGFKFAPSAGAPTSVLGQDFALYYHRINATLVTPLTVGANFFPTPNAFDISLIDLAEAEIKRVYRLGGWADAIQKSQASTMLLLDKYRSPKRDLAGIAEQTKEVQEKSLNQAQAGG